MTNVKDFELPTKGKIQAEGKSTFILQKIFKKEADFLDGVKCLIGRKEAAELLEFNTKNRKLKPALVSKYAALMDEGEWKFSPNSWVGLTTSLQLPDKQHTLNAIVKSGKPQWFFVFSELDDDLIFYLDEGKKRTAGDLGKLMGLKDYSLMCSITRAVIAFKAGGTSSATNMQSHITSKLTNKKIVDRAKTDDRIRLSTDMANMLKGQKPVMLTGGQIGLYYYLLSEVNEQDAFNFMQKLILGVNLDEFSPIKRLRDYLTSEKMKGRRLGGQALEFYLRRAWYKYRKNEHHVTFKLFKKGESKMVDFI